MARTATTNRPGLVVAGIFDSLGWGVAFLGVLLALVGAFQGAPAGTENIQAVGIALARLSIVSLGVTMVLLGLGSIMMAAQTRAAIQTADLTREMLALMQRGTSGQRIEPRLQSAAGISANEEAAAHPRARTDPQVVLTRPKTEVRSNPIFSAKPPR